MQRTVAAVAVVVAVAWAWAGAEFEVGRLLAGLPRMAEFLARMVPPDTNVARTVAASTLETVQMALFGTFLSALASLVLGLMAAGNLAPRWLSGPTKMLLGTLRAIPLILLALMFVSTVGLGPLPGVLALAVHSTGMLGKFYSEAFENAGAGALEALDSAGASWLQKVRYGVVTQVAPDLARDTMFRFELNLRESLVLGLVGAGGIGFYIQLYVRSFQYERVATLTIVVIVIVIAVEQVSVLVRNRLRARLGQVATLLHQRLGTSPRQAELLHMMLPRNQRRYRELVPTLLGMPQVIAGLHVHPQVGTGIQGNGQPHRHLRTNPGMFVDKLGKRLTGYTETLGSLGNGNTQRLDPLSSQDTARVGRIMHSHHCLLMMINVIN